MTKKPRNLFQVKNVLLIIGAYASIVGLLYSISSTLNASSEFLIALFSIVISFVVGFYGKRLTLALHKLNRAKRVFISYPHHLESDAIKVAGVLRKKGAKVWIGKEHLLPDMSFELTIGQAIDDTDTMVVFIGSQMTANVLYEIGYAKGKGKKIVPVILEEADIPSDLKNLAYIDLRDPKESGLEEIVDATI